MTIKFAMTHLLFFGMVAALAMMCWKFNEDRVTNASLALYTLSIGALAKSCVSFHSVALLA